MGPSSQKKLHISQNFDCYSISQVNSFILLSLSQRGTLSGLIQVKTEALVKFWRDRIKTGKSPFGRSNLCSSFS